MHGIQHLGAARARMAHERHSQTEVASTIAAKACVQGMCYRDEATSLAVPISVS